MADCCIVISFRFVAYWILIVLLCLQLVQLIAESPGSHVSTELGALCVNLALYPRNAELMCGVAEDDKTLTGHGKQRNCGNQQPQKYNSK